MENKRDSAKEFNIVIMEHVNETNANITQNQLQIALQTLAIPFYSFILHDNFSDYELNNQETRKNNHYHVVVKLDKVMSFQTLLNGLTHSLGASDSSFIQIEKCVSLNSSIRYLIHKDIPEKYQFSTENLITNDIDIVLEALTDYEKPTTLTITRWLENGAFKSDLLKIIGLTNYNTYTGLINSLSSSYSLEKRVKELEYINAKLYQELDNAKDQIQEIEKFNAKMLQILTIHNLLGEITKE